MPRLCPIVRLPCTRCADEASCKTQRRVGQLLRVIGAENENEALGAFHALRRFYAGADVSSNDIGNRFEDMKYNDADADRIHAHGVAQGQQEQAQVGASSRILSLDYFDDNGTPRWDAIIKLGEDNLLSLTQKQQDVITEMPGKLRRWGRPAAWQESFLISILWQIRRSLR